MRAVVTGGAGFIGRQIVAALLARGVEVVVPTRRIGATQPGLRWLAADLLAPEGRAAVAAIRADLLIHAAWTTEHGAFWTAPENALWQESSLALSRAVLDAGARRIVGIGTCVEYDVSGEAPLVEEVSALKPIFPYAIAKDATRRAIDTLCVEAGAGFAWARLFHLFGPFEDPRRLVPSVIRALLAGEEARTSHGQQIRDFLSSVDAGMAIAHVALSAVTGAVNIGSGHPVSIAGLVERIAGMIGPRHLLRLGALPARADDPAVIVPSIARLAETGFAPTADLETRLGDAIAFWKAEAHL